jgi:hypothetical protein
MSTPRSSGHLAWAISAGHGMCSLSVDVSNFQSSQSRGRTSRAPKRATQASPHQCEALSSRDRGEVSQGSPQGSPPGPGEARPSTDRSQSSEMIGAGSPPGLPGCVSLVTPLAVPEDVRPRSHPWCNCVCLRASTRRQDRLSSLADDRHSCGLRIPREARRASVQ